MSLESSAGSSLVEAIGWFGNACFFSRFFVQWWASEKAGRSVAPRAFWKISIAGALAVAIYTFARHQFVLLPSYAVGGVIATRNLQYARGAPKRLAPNAALVLAFLAIGLMIALATHATRSAEGESAPWLALAVLGQALWSSRFVLQWWASESRGESHFPAHFWWISLVGNLLLLAYALHLRDAVYIAGFVPGPLVQIRNLMLHRERAEQA